MGRVRVKAKTIAKVKSRPRTPVKAGSVRSNTSGGIFTSKVIAIVKKNG